MSILDPPAATSAALTTGLAGKAATAHTHVPADVTGGVTSVAGRTGVVVLTKADVSLANVDNTADTAKPVSTAQQSALNLKAPMASPTLTGTVTVPTPLISTVAATKGYVDGIIAAIFPNLGTQRIAFVGYGATLPGTGTDGDVFFKQLP